MTKYTLLLLVVLFPLSLIAQPVEESDEEIKRIISEESGLGFIGAGESATAVAGYDHQVDQAVPLIRVLLKRVQGPAVEFLRITQAIAKGGLGYSGYDLGVGAQVAVQGGIGFNGFVGVSESARGNMRLHLGFGGQAFENRDKNSGLLGIIAGLMGRSFRFQQPSGSGTWEGNQSGGGFILGYSSESVDHSNGMRSDGFIAGVGAGYVGNSETKSSAIRVPVLPIPGIFVSSTRRQIYRLNRLQDEIVRAFHSLDLERAEAAIQRFELELSTLRTSLEGRWISEPQFADKNLPAGHAFSSARSLYHFSRVAALRSSLRALVSWCLSR